MKEFKEEHLRKIIEESAAENELHEFDDIIFSQFDAQPKSDFTDKVISKFNASSTKVGISLPPPLFVAILLLGIALIFVFASGPSAESTLPTLDLENYFKLPSIENSVLLKGLVFANVILGLLVLDRMLDKKSSAQASA